MPFHPPSFPLVDDIGGLHSFAYGVYTFLAVGATRNCGPLASREQSFQTWVVACGGATGPKTCSLYSSVSDLYRAELPAGQDIYHFLKGDSSNMHRIFE